MSDVKKKADSIRASYMMQDALDEDVHFVPLDEDEVPYACGLNMKRYSQDGHSWNGRPYVCIDTKRF